MDETWIHHFTSGSNQQSAEWTAADKSCPKQPKMQTSAGKLLALRILGCTRSFVNRLPLEKKKNQ